ncbi:MAG: CPBP family intramembrane metalloprotease [Symploca sp. SIO1C2]|nr:CPBP family intramembrane metalloprotease [Symploca sp. SIO1C2]
MTIKRVILIGLTILAIAKVILSLVASWNEPQIQSRLELYQTNLFLSSTEWQGDNNDNSLDLTAARDAIIGNKPFQKAQQQYQQVLESAQTTKSQLIAKLQELSSEPVLTLTNGETSEAIVEVITDTPVSPQQQQWEKSLVQEEKLIDELDLRLGILQVQQGETKAALETWTNLVASAQTPDLVPVAHTSSVQTAQVLIALWQEPVNLLPNAEAKIKGNLDGWFSDRALTQLYQLQQNQDQLASLQTKKQQRAEQAILKLGLISLIPGVGGLLGVGLVIFLLVQWLLQGKKSLLATNGGIPWETPWDGEVIWQVLIFGFFFIGQILLPLLIPILFAVLGLNPGNFTVQMKAFYTLFSYILLAASGLLVLYFSIKPFLPVSEDWFSLKFRSNWILWGLGGYLVALPSVVIVSLINQQLWQGKGGSNPILPLVLEGNDSIAMFIFGLTACVAAPLFEEIIFRGFLLPSLTRYLPVWGAIVTSGLLFAIAHLSLSEVLPLATLGIVLGLVYTRSRNLLAPMLLHSLWNSGTLLSLFILGSQ